MNTCRIHRRPMRKGAGICMGIAVESVFHGLGGEANYLFGGLEFPQGGIYIFQLQRVCY